MYREIITFVVPVFVVYFLGVWLVSLWVVRGKRKRNTLNDSDADMDRALISFFWPFLLIIIPIVAIFYYPFIWTKNLVKYSHDVAAGVREVNVRRKIGGLWWTTKAKYSKEGS
jgi:hypothetical protein